MKAAFHHGLLGARASASTPPEARREARRWAALALQLDDTLAEAHSVLARAAQQEWDWATAEREYRRAIELNPNSFVARIWYTMYLDAMQRFDEAIVQAKRAQQLDPASPLNEWAAATYVYAGRTEE
jgi:tetratricopeptide (TPR) repeat protein